jgi:hypothetical protein
MMIILSIGGGKYTVMTIFSSVSKVSGMSNQWEVYLVGGGTLCGGKVYEMSN